MQDESDILGMLDGVLNAKPQADEHSEEGRPMTMFDRYFGARQSSGDQDYAMPSHQTAKEFGKVDVRRTGAELHIRFTILMEPEGREAEGWQTGVALDASASMKTWYGRELQGTVPPFLIQEYERK